MFRCVCRHQSLRAGLVSNKTAAVDLVPFMITQWAPVRSATGKLLSLLHLIDSEWNVCIRMSLNHFESWARLHSVHALKHARGCMCPSVWVTSAPSTTLYLRLCRLCIPLCVGGSRHLMWLTVASSLPLDSDQWPAPAWAGPVKMTIAVTVSCQTHWSGSPQSHDPGHVT